MYLKSFVLENFRKFGTKNNKIEFVDAKSIQQQIQNQNEENRINIAPTTTLIVGKNNCGKSTIIKALDNLINNDIKSFKSSDFNYIYLEKLLDRYVESGTKLTDNMKKNIKTPFLKFLITIGIENDSDDLVTNLVPFMRLEDVEAYELLICIKLELENEEVFMNNIKKMLEENSNKERENLFRKFLKIIDESDFKLNYYNVDNEMIENFKLKHLIELRSIKANNIEGDSSLSKAFNRIIEYRYKALLEKGSNDLNDKINEINTELTELISESHTRSINQSLEEIESNEKLKMLLRADLSFKKVLNNLITYEYVERNLSIPENQFGLGYTNLMMIIADLIDYMEKYPENSFNSMVNLISIEEPETFMHPQMQEMFIKNINEAISSLLKGKNKNVNSQLIITTHSSHILNSKIHSGNTFNNINYITIKGNLSCAVNLHDDIIIPDDNPIPNQSEDNTSSNKKENDLKFLKKHIKYKVSELFFSDAVIFVEGITEETILKYYIDQDSTLRKYYISIFNIDGAHGLVYHQLIKLLKVPTLIITDLDIQRTKEEKDSFNQITDRKDRITTNKTIKKYNGNSDKLENLSEKIEDGNLYIAYQGQINGYYATSFEEAYILTNYKNDLLNSVIQKMKPDIYKGITGEGNDKTKVKENSYKLQRKLSNNKSDFANELLYRFITATDEEVKPDLPKYINDGIEWLARKLGGGRY